MVDNPFAKNSFNTYRDWEESLVGFFVEEARQPSSQHWLSMVEGADSKASVAFSALFLYNLLSNNLPYSKAAKTLYSVFEILSEKECDATDFETWLHTDWLNVSRVANMFKSKLSHQSLTARIHLI